MAIWLTGTLSWWSILVGIAGGLITAAGVYLFQLTISSALIDTIQESRLARLAGARTDSEVLRSNEARSATYKFARNLIRRWEDLGFVLARNPDSERRASVRLQQAFEEFERQLTLSSTPTSFRYAPATEEIRQLLLLDLPPDQVHDRLRNPIGALSELVKEEAAWNVRREGGDAGNEETGH